MYLEPKVASQRSLDWNQIEGWLRNMEALQDSLAVSFP